MAVESRHYDQLNWISKLDGTYFHFQGDTLKIGSVRSEIDKWAAINYLNKKQFTIKFLNEGVIDTIGIYQVSSDSITLLFNNNMLVQFVPMDFTFNSDLRWQDLINNEWEVKVNGELESVHFLDEGWFEGMNSIRRCIFQDRVEMYSFSSINGSQFLSITYGQTDLFIYQIKRFENGIIYTKSYDPNRYFEDLEFIQSQDLTQSELLNIQSDLTGRWETEELLGYGPGLNDLSGESQIEGNTWHESEMLSKESLLNEELSFEFTQDLYRIFERDCLVFEGEYQISGDGRFVILNKGSMPSDYVHLFDIKTNYLIMGKLDEFSVDQHGAYEEHFYKVRLEKKG